MPATLLEWLNQQRQKLRLPASDLWHDRVYRRLWFSILVSSLGGQITMLALPLTAAVLLNASPTQMGWLTAMELVPFAVFSLPAGVWLDRVRKLPVYIAGEALLGVVLLSVPLAWWLGVLSMTQLYVVGFTLGLVSMVAGAAAQIVLTQVVPRERLVEAHSRNALASSSADVAGPGVAGVLIKLLGAPVALLADVLMLIASVGILRGLHVREERPKRTDTHFWHDLREGLHFVATHRLLVTLGWVFAVWQLCHHCAVVVQILYATRTLGLNEHQVGLCYIGLGFGTIAASLFGSRLSRWLGPGRSLVLGSAVCGWGWLQLALVPAGPWGVVAFVWALLCFGLGAVLMFINFVSLRQAVTPAHLLGRMTSTMRWLVLLPAGPGALLGGYIGEHWGLRWSLGLAGSLALVLALLIWVNPHMQRLASLPLNKKTTGTDSETLPLVPPNPQ